MGLERMRYSWTGVRPHKFVKGGEAFAVRSHLQVSVHRERARKGAVSGATAADAAKADAVILEMEDWTAVTWYLNGYAMVLEGVRAMDFSAVHLAWRNQRSRARMQLPPFGRGCNGVRCL